MRARLEFAMSFVKEDREIFGMHNVVHVDEKWFYLTKVNGKFYVYDDEELPLCATKSKNFITKVMFLAAVARPRHDEATNQFFDGKLGMWPFVIQEPAKRTSKNRARGTVLTTPISVTSEVYFDMLVSNVLPAIKRKMLFMKNSKIFIQQDNAGPHSKSVNHRFNQVRSYDGWNVALKNQPANSPDFNVLDLGFFNSIQSLQYQSTPSNIDELIDAVNDAFSQLSHETLAKTFLTLQKVMELSMEVGGGNNFKLPHMYKDKTGIDLIRTKLCAILKQLRRLCVP
ncbi:hypothetical protein LEN26_018040 [Aphanomyces euteiches]|nr:hypothetical protein LEN26_018040 [Aphanomyces euteiches]